MIKNIIAIILLAVAIIFLILYSISINRRRNGYYDSMSYDTAYNEIKRYVETHPDETIKVGIIAEMFRISPYTARDIAFQLAREGFISVYYN